MDFYYIFAGSPNTPQRVLTRLALCAKEKVRGRIAENRVTLAEILQVLAGDEHWEVRASVATNPTAPQEVVEILSRDENADVRYSMAECDHMQFHVLDRLANDENPYVAERARITLEQMFVRLAI